MKVQDKIQELKADKQFIFDKYLRYYESSEVGCEVLFYSNMVDLIIKKLNKVEEDEIPQELISSKDFELLRALYDKCIQLMKD